MKLIAIAYAAVVVVLSLSAFIAYGFDKRRAQLAARRVPEKTLHLMSLMGGWPGALAGQQFFRHKTRKLSFQLMYWLTVICNLAIVGGVVYLLRR